MSTPPLLRTSVAESMIAPQAIPRAAEGIYGTAIQFAQQTPARVLVMLTAHAVSNRPICSVSSLTVEVEGVVAPHCILNKTDLYNVNFNMMLFDLVASVTRKTASISFFFESLVFSLAPSPP